LSEIFQKKHFQSENTPETASLRKVNEILSKFKEIKFNNSPSYLLDFSEKLKQDLIIFENLLAPHSEKKIIPRTATADICFVCSCQKHELVYSLKFPLLWFWHESRLELPHCLNIPTSSFVICILHCFQRIVEKQMAETLKNNMNAYALLSDFFSKINKTKLTTVIF